MFISDPGFMIYVTDESCSRPLQSGHLNANAIGNPTTFLNHTFVMRNGLVPVLKYIIWALPVTDVGISGHPALKKTNNERV
jgi:hypothetical protein